MADLTGSEPGPYQIVEEIGHGGMANVYRAVQTSIGREVAIKVLPAHFLQDRTFLERFNREVQVIARLQAEPPIELSRILAKAHRSRPVGRHLRLSGCGSADGTDPLLLHDPRTHDQQPEGGRSADETGLNSQHRPDEQNEIERSNRLVIPIQAHIVKLGAKQGRGGYQRTQRGQHNCRGE